MQLLDSEQIEIADEYFRFRAINPLCAGDSVSVHSVGRMAVCPVPRSAGHGRAAAPCALCTHARRHRHRHTRVLARPVLCAVFERDATPISTQSLLTQSGGSGGKAEERQRARKTGEGNGREAEFRVTSLSGLRERRDGGYCYLRFFKANKAKGSARKNNSNPNTFVVRSYSWGHFIRKSRVIPFFCWDQAIKTQV